MSEDNVRLIQSGYDAYAHRDFAAIFALLHPEIEIVQTDRLPWGGVYRGLEQAQNFFRKLGELTEGTPEPTEYIDAGDQVAAIGRLRGRVRGNGQTFDLAIVHLWTVQAGKVVRFEAYIDTPGMLRALGAETNTDST